jgi:hypothetical protein
MKRRPLKIGRPRDDGGTSIILMLLPVLKEKGRTLRRRPPPVPRHDRYRKDLLSLDQRPDRYCKDLRLLPRVSFAHAPRLQPLDRSLSRHREGPLRLLVQHGVAHHARQVLPERVKHRELVRRPIGHLAGPSSAPMGRHRKGLYQPATFLLAVRYLTDRLPPDRYRKNRLPQRGGDGGKRTFRSSTQIMHPSPPHRSLRS